MNKDSNIDIDFQWYRVVGREDYLAFEKLFKKYYEALCRYAESLLADSALAEDAVQDIFIHFWENRHKLDIKDSVRSYLYTCVRHRALKILRKQVTVRRHCPRLTEFVEYLQHSEYSVEEEQEITRIKTVMQELPAQCLKVFMMSAIEEKKYSEIAEELSISVNTVKTHISKAYRMIRSQLHSKTSLILWYWLLSRTAVLKVEKMPCSASDFK